MEYSVKGGSPMKSASACLVIGVYRDAQLATDADTLGATAYDHLQGILAQGDLEGDTGQNMLI